jgi:hypothetical protein
MRTSLCKHKKTHLGLGIKFNFFIVFPIRLLAFKKSSCLIFLAVSEILLIISNILRIREGLLIRIC